MQEHFSTTKGTEATKKIYIKLRVIRGNRNFAKVAAQSIASLLTTRNLKCEHNL